MWLMWVADSNTIPRLIQGNLFTRNDMSNSQPTAPDAEAKKEEASSGPILQFDMSASLRDLENRLAEEKQIDNTGTFAARAVEVELFNLPVKQETEVANTKIELTLDDAESDIFSSGLLDELAQEASNKLESSRSEEQIAQAKSKRLNAALERIAKFFFAFVKHVNHMEPAIPRTYRLDARTVFDGLKWRGAYVDSRKQNLSATATWDYVSFFVRYCTARPVTVMRPWTQLAALKVELARLDLRVMDKDDLDDRKARQEWLQALLLPEVPVLLEFRGNYQTGFIEVKSRNVAMFNAANYRLDPAEVSPALLDDIGRVLLGRVDRLPHVLQPVT
jgi:hypothetical protein